MAQLRLLLVEPDARGQGLGQQLVHECLAFARAVGYRQVRLWTDPSLIAAKRLYECQGFSLTRTDESHGFGNRAAAELWEIDLS